MNGTKRHMLALILVLALLAIPTVAFAKELGMLTISGPGINSEVILDNHDDMMNLEQSGFFDQASFAKPPENLGDGYNITAHLNLDGQLVPFVQMVYYPAEDGQQGYVHYTARLNGESLQTVDQWSQLRPNAELTLRNVMTANNITIQPAILAAAPAVESVPSVTIEGKSASEPASVQAVAPTLSQTYYVGAALAASILILLGAGFVWKRRAINQRSV